MIQLQYDPDGRRFELEAGGTVFHFPALMGLALADWHRTYADVYLRHIDAGRLVIARARREGNTTRSMVRSVKHLLAAQQVTTERLVDALQAYAITGDLTREWIEETLSDEQLIFILRKIVTTQG